MSYPGVRKRVTFYVTDNTQEPPVLADPTTFTITYGPMVGNTTAKAWPVDGEVVHGGTGVFHIDVDGPTSGRWGARGVAAGAVVGAWDVYWSIDPSEFV